MILSNFPVVDIHGALYHRGGGSTLPRFCFSETRFVMTASPPLPRRLSSLPRAVCSHSGQSQRERPTPPPPSPPTTVAMQSGLAPPPGRPRAPPVLARLLMLATAARRHLTCSLARPFCFALRLRGAGAFRGRARCPPASAEEQEEGSRGAAGPRFPAKEKRERGPRGAAAARLVPPPSWRWASCPCRAASAEPGGSLGGQGEARREPGSRPAGRHGARRRRWWCCCRGGAGPGPLWMVVKMIIENFEALKSWLSKTLEPM